MSSEFRIAAQVLFRSKESMRGSKRIYPGAGRCQRRKNDVKELSDGIALLGLEEGVPVLISFKTGRSTGLQVELHRIEPESQAGHGVDFSLDDFQVAFLDLNEPLEQLLPLKR